MTSPQVRAPASLVVAANSAAAVVIGIAWYAAAGELRVGDQLPWITAASLAVLFAASADAGFVLHLRRRLLVRRHAVEFWASGASGDVVTIEGTSPAVNVEPMSVAVSGGSLAHRPGCVLVTRKSTVPADDQAPCPVCQP